MKCKAKDEWRIDMTVQAYREYGMIAMEWIDCVFGCGLADEFGFREVRLGRFYNGQRDYLEDMLKKFEYDNGLAYDPKFKKMRKQEEFEITFDALATATDQMSRRLRECGFRDPALSEIGLPEPEERFRTKRQEMSSVLRSAWWGLYGYKATVGYVMASLLHIRETEEFGAERLGRVYGVCAGSIRSFVIRFLDGSTARDMELHAQLDGMFRRLLDCGVSFEKEIKDTLRFVDRIQPKVPAVEDDLNRLKTAAAAAPDDYRKILAEVTAGRSIV